MAGILGRIVPPTSPQDRARRQRGPRHARQGIGGRAVGALGIARVWLIVGAAVIVVLAATGIGLGLALGGGKSAAPKATTTTSPPTTATPAPACPLTGTPAPNGTVPQRPAAAFKVDNYPTARPQSGLDKADVVYEEPVEGNLTRLVAVFQCQSSDLVGPIRSARAVDVQIVDALSHPFIVHVGGINPVLAMVAAADDINVDLGNHGGIIQRPAGRYAPYNTYVSTDSVWGLQSNDTTPPAPLFTYASTAPAGTPLGSIHIPFGPSNDVTWTWDAPSNHWLLAYGGAPATVASGAQISSANVVIQTVQVTYGPWLENSSPNSFEVNSQLTGSGPVLVLRNGEEISGTWSRPSLSSPTTFTASNGTVIPLAPGPTWVEIVPARVGVSSH